MVEIVETPDAFTSFVSGISSEALVKIIASDSLVMAEDSIWNLVLSWACNQMKLSKTAVEARLSSLDDEKNGEEPLDGMIISSTQLNQLKKILAPLLPSIRFSLFDPNDYRYIANILMYILPRRRFLEINQYFLYPDSKELLDVPRRGTIEQKISSKIVTESTTWRLLRKDIFEAGGITGCRSANDLKFELLFRATEHGFLASTFHRLCDNKGPTLVIVRSADGHLFGGVSFNDWESYYSYSSCALNFLFALSDGCHRKVSTIFKVKEAHTIPSCNFFGWGPCFGERGDDLSIADSANTNQDSYSNLPCSYNGNGASETALAGSCNFLVSDYEVFAISKL